MKKDGVADEHGFDDKQVYIRIIKLLVWFKIKKWEKTSLMHLTRTPILTSTSGRKIPSSLKHQDLILATLKHTGTKEHSNSLTPTKFSSPPKRTTKSTSVASSGGSTNKTQSTRSFSNPTFNHSYVPHHTWQKFTSSIPKPD